MYITELFEKFLNMRLCLLPLPQVISECNIGRFSQKKKKNKPTEHILNMYGDWLQTDQFPQAKNLNMYYF